MNKKSSARLKPGRKSNDPVSDPDVRVAPFFNNDFRLGFILSYLLLNMTGSAVSLKDFLSELERDIIEKTLKVCKGNQCRAASLLCLKKTTLNEKISRLGLRKR